MVRSYSHLVDLTKAIEALHFLKIPYSIKAEPSSNSLSGSLNYKVIIGDENK